MAISAETGASSGDTVSPAEGAFKGFVDYTNAAGRYVQWSVSAESAGAMPFEIRYANGTAANRPMDITVNGVLVADELAFGAIGGWDTRASKAFSANLNAGTNTVRATATPASGGPERRQAAHKRPVHRRIHRGTPRTTGAVR